MAGRKRKKLAGEGNESLAFLCRKPSTEAKAKALPAKGLFSAQGTDPSNSLLTKMASCDEMVGVLQK